MSYGSQFPRLAHQSLLNPNVTKTQEKVTVQMRMPASGLVKSRSSSNEQCTLLPQVLVSSMGHIGPSIWMNESILRRNRNQFQSHYGLHHHGYVILGVQPTVTTLCKKVRCKWLSQSLGSDKVLVLYMSVLEKTAPASSDRSATQTTLSREGTFIIKILMEDSNQKPKHCKIILPVSGTQTSEHQTHFLPFSSRASSPRSGLMMTLKAPMLSHSCLDIQISLGLLASDPFPKFLGKKRYWPNLKGAHLWNNQQWQQHWFNFNNHVDGWI